MKKRNKVFSFFLFVVVTIFLINLKSLKADTPLVEALDGASIRTEGEQGLRYYAKLDESVKENEHGFFLLFGKVTVADLNAALNEPKVDGYHQHNGKDIVEVKVSGITLENEFSVVLIGIPEEGYLDQLSVIPYVIVDKELVLPEKPVTRSIGQVALIMANAGDLPPAGILSVISEDYKRVAFNAFDELEITDSLFETNHFLLREEFIKDWNEMFKTTWTELNGTAFHNSAKTGLKDDQDNINSNTDIAGTNIYEFFNDDVYKTKWTWLLDIICILDEASGTVHPKRQAEAIKGDGKHSGGLWHTIHLSHSITNFFNADDKAGGYSAVKFLTKDRYSNITLNDKIYVDVVNYDYVFVGNNYQIPAPEARLGYNFVNYKDGSLEVNPGAYEITATNRLFAKVYQTIIYDVIFYDDEVELTDLNTTYTIESGKVLPEPTKEGMLFEGWHENSDLTDNSITSISKGSTGNKTYYAKFITGPKITLELDGGNFYLYETRAAMVADFMADFNAYFSSKPDISASRFQLDTYQWNVPTIFSSEMYGAKWAWMRSYIIQVAADQNHASKTHLEANEDGYWRGSINSFLNETVRVDYPVSADYTNEPAANGFWPLLINDKPLKGYFPGVAFTLPEPIKSGYEFVGWYSNPLFSGEPVTIISAEQEESLTLYANWEEIEEYNIIYNLDGGKTVYATKDELINGFLDDFYEYLKLTSSINDFKHGLGKTTGYDGQWHSVHKLKIYAGPKPTEVNNAYFSSSEEYMDKWLGFFDMIDDFIKEVNEEQFFWGAGTSTGLIRIRQYIINVKPSTNVTEETMAMMPEVPIEAPKIEIGRVNVPLTLQEAYKEGKTFVGWYLTSDYSGTKVTVLNISTKEDVTLYAKFE